MVEDEKVRVNIHVVNSRFSRVKPTLIDTAHEPHDLIINLARLLVGAGFFTGAGKGGLGDRWFPLMLDRYDTRSRLRTTVG